MFWRRFASLFVVLAIFGLPSCGGAKKKAPVSKLDKVPVTPVKGIINVDGTPKPGIQCQFVPQDELAAKWNGRKFASITNDAGEFNVNAYQDEKGLPAGKYAVTFIWPTETMKKRSQKELEASDQLKKKYLNVTPNSKRVEVEEGKPLDLGTIELTTK